MSLTNVQSKSTKGSSTTPSVTLDVAPAAGDLIFVVISANEDAGDVTVTVPPTGYTLISNVNDSGNVREWTYWKQAGVAESATIGATLSASRNWKIAVSQDHDSAGGTWSLDQSATDSGDSTTAKSGTTAATTRSNEVCYAGLTNKNGATTQGSPSTGFSAIQTLSGTNGAGDQRTVLYRKGATSIGAQSTQAKLSAQKRWVGAVATFKTNATVTGSFHFAGGGSMRYRGLIPTDEPTLRVEAGFGSGPTDFAPVWTDIFDYFYGVTWQYGRQNELNQTAAGTAAVRLLDEFSHWDAANVDSPFYPYIRPGIPIRAYIIDGITIYPLFRMALERLPRTVRVADRYTERELDLIDGFAILANAGLGGFSYASEESGARVNNVADDIGWPADARRIDSGVSTLMAASFPDDDDTRAQTHLLQVADSENGLFFCDAAGELVFVDRHELIQNSAYVVPVATFTDGIDVSPTTGAYRLAVLEDSPVSFWRLSERVGAVADDAVGVNPGAYVGGVTLNQAGAVPPNRAVRLDGSTGYVSVPHDASLNRGDVWTLECWVKRNGVGTDDYLISKGTNGYGMFLTAGSGVVQLVKVNSAPLRNSSISILADGLWHHVVGVKDGSNRRDVYIDGVLRNGTDFGDSTCADTAAALNIGREVSTNTSFLNGSIDEVAVYPTALTAARALAHYQAATT